MSRLVLFLAAACAVCGVAYAQTQQFNATEAANLTRACAPKPGASVIRMQATTSADADSGALGYNRLYMMMCDTDAWVRWGSTAADAAAHDWKLPAHMILFFLSGGSGNAVHVSAKSVTSNGDCRLLECR
jgi:hypothetical protein